MKSALVAAPLLMMVLAASPFVRGSDAPDRPSGVAKEAWIPISERLGFVVVAPPSSGLGTLGGDRRQVLLVPGPTPPIQGYFMVKRPSGWSRTLIVEPLPPGDVGLKHRG